ncbi:unnamed protein product [Caenorhabditis brenneri]
MAMNDNPRNAPAEYVNVSRSLLAIRSELKEFDPKFTTINQCVTGVDEHPDEEYLKPACKNLHDSIRRVSAEWNVCFGYHRQGPNNRMRELEQSGCTSLNSLDGMVSRLCRLNKEQRRNAVSDIEADIKNVKDSVDKLVDGMRRRR